MDMGTILASDKSYKTLRKRSIGRLDYRKSTLARAQGGTINPCHFRWEFLPKLVLYDWGAIKGVTGRIVQQE